MISSLTNARVKHVKRLQADRRFRDRAQEFVLEGTRMLHELAAFPTQATAVFCTEEWLAEPRQEALLSSMGQRPVLVTPTVLAAMSDTETPAGVLALATIEPLPLPEIPTLALILDALTNPGNLGSILRSAAAVGVDAVLLGPGCVDAFNPKVVRGGMGAHFRVPLRHWEWPQICDYCDPLNIWLTEAGASTVYANVDWRRPSALVIGSEAHGVGEEARGAAYGSVTIPMAHDTESLNAAAAATVLLFEAFRQRGFAA